MNKKLSFFSFMVIIKLSLIKSIDTLFICDAQAIHFVYQHFDT